MAETTAGRSRIKEVACKRIYGHYSFGYPAEDAPSVNELKAKHFDLAAFIEGAYNCEGIDDKLYGYRKLLCLTEQERLRFQSIDTSFVMKVKPSEWEA